MTRHSVQRDAIVVGRTPIQLLLRVCGGALIAWVLFAYVVVPPMIKAAYRGESFAVLNRIIEGQLESPVEFYLALWQQIAMTFLVAGASFAVFSVVASSRAFFTRFVGPASAGTLGAIRMWTCAVLLLITLWDDLGSLALLPSGYRMQMGLMTLFHLGPIGTFYEAFLSNQLAMRMFQWATELMLFLGLVGWRTKIVLPVATILAFIFSGILREYSGFWHQGLVPLYVLAILCFTPCGNGWSIDRLIRIYKGDTVPDASQPAAVYGWARYVCWAAIALTYTAAGLSKLRSSGLDWMSATSMKGMLFEQTLYPRAGNFSVSLHLATAPDIVFVLLAVAAIAGEVFFITVLFSRWARLILPAIIILMHVGILLTQNILFLDFMLLLLIFYDFSGIRAKAGAWWRRRAPMQVLFDGQCPLCRRTVRVLAAMDVLCRLDFVDFRSVDLAQFNAQRSVRLTQDALEREMFVLRGNRTYSGFDSYRAMALCVPALWPLVPFLFVPGVSAIGRMVYAYVARNRLAFAACDDSCPVEAPTRELAEADGSRATSRVLFAYGTGTVALATVMSLFWALSFEYYPFTDMHMFANAKTSVTYYKVFGHWSSGEVSPFRLEDTLDVMSINSRYEPLFDLCFGAPGQTTVCKDTLAVLLSAYNRRTVPPDRTLKDIEIQRWKWDYVASPDDPAYGALDARFVAGISATVRQARDVVTPGS